MQSIDTTLTHMNTTHKKNILAFTATVILMITQGYAQHINTDIITKLDEPLEETSGLVWIGSSLWTHNDSGGEAALYEIDTATGNIARTVTIANASNYDWEDITSNNTHVFIGDFGNNYGNRKDLKIYRIDKNKIIEGADTVMADTITFAYTNQTQFSFETYTTNFDCEAMIAVDDSIFLFSKNWGNHKTYIYGMPNTPGEYGCVPLDSLNVDGLITGAAYNRDKEEVLLIGYKPYLAGSFIVLLSNYSNHNFFEATNITIGLMLMLHQTEGIEFLRESEFVFSYESQANITVGLRRGDFNKVQNILNEEYDIYKPIVYPNPITDFIHIKNCRQFDTIYIYDINGQLVITLQVDSDEMELDLNHLYPGVYPIEFVSRNKFFTDIIVKK